ncbi:hypothetical protein HYT18_02265 [Candidatus Microgenomates bacterium]|nr:hypothetical protein [Candidatus Microgenomates bacterium]
MPKVFDNQTRLGDDSTVLATLGKTRIKKIRLTPTIGPSVKVDLGSI